MRPLNCYFLFALSISLSASWSFAATAGPDPGERVSYAQHVLPILSRNCFACHGPDESHRKAKLRLDVREDALSAKAFVPGEPEKSDIVARMLTSDPEEIMPPPEAHKTMKPEEIALIKQWIQEGAAYELHWSFNPLKRPDVPETAKDPWVRTPVDAFILNSLAKSKLKPNPESDPARLIRRLNFDLTGLPPEPALVERFTKNPTDAEYEKIVDELLASKTYGEQQARLWLDAVRYADTHGIHIDNFRAIWPYRDWVVNAFNANMPFDQFTVEQIAGDLLPNATQQQKVATGYNRCLPTTSEAGIIEAEYDVIYANDRVATTMGIWQGLSAQCAACHDHKFDPLKQKEFYQLTAFFRNNTMSVRDGNVEDHPPFIRLYTADHEKQKKELHEKLKPLHTQLGELVKTTQPDHDTWLTTFAADGKKVKLPGQVRYVPMVSGSELKDTVTGEAVAEGLRGGGGILGGGPLFEVGTAVPLRKQIAPLDLKKGFSFGAFYRTDPHVKTVLWSQMATDASSRGWRLTSYPEHLELELVDTWPTKALRAIVPLDLSDGRYHHFFTVFDPKAKTAPLKCYVDGREVAIKLKENTLDPQQHSIAGENIPVRFGGYTEERDGQIPSLIVGRYQPSDFRLYDRPLSAAEVFSLQAVTAERFAKGPVDKRPKQATDYFRRLYLSEKNPEGKKLQSQIDALEDQLARIDGEAPLTLVMEEKKKGEPKAHILARGDYAAKGEEVGAATPAFLPPMPTDVAKNRLAFANWLMAKENPLTARVTMNRFWRYLFGRTFVESVGDLGVSGDMPTHPKLLDWLAADFQENGWDVKRMMKLMVMSSTYRQSQTVTPEKLEKDPENRLFSRGPRYRLDGEQLRDMALANSQLLSRKMGGSPVKPYQPERIWEEVAMTVSNTANYRQDIGESLYRRSLYSLWKRSAPLPSMTLLNAPERDVSCVRRDLTNTPLQAFVLLNDPQFVEAARKAAENLLKSPNSFSERADLLGKLFLARTFHDPEKAALESTLKAALERFTSQPEKAAQLIDVGETPADPAIPSAELAAWTLVASQVMNLDETITK